MKRSFGAETPPATWCSRTSYSRSNALPRKGEDIGALLGGSSAPPVGRLERGIKGSNASPATRRIPEARRFP
jgi:hypothetical protein